MDIHPKFILCKAHLYAWPLSVFFLIEIMGCTGKKSSQISASQLSDLSKRNCSADDAIKDCVLKNKKTVADQACGVSDFVEKEDASCVEEGNQAKQPIYILKESPFCPPKEYNTNLSSLCPGYVSSTEYTKHFATTCGGTVQPYHTQCDQPSHIVLNTEIITEDCIVNMEIKKRRTGAVKCRIPETLTTCARPEFGVKSFMECRVAQNGVEHYPSCKRSAFGYIYNQCSLLMTTSEVNAFINNSKVEIKEISTSLFQLKAKVAAAEGGEAGFACLIKKFSLMPHMDEVLADMKTQYELTYGHIFDPNRYSCNVDGAPVPPHCESSSYTEYCLAQQWLKNAHNIFEYYDTVIKILLDDPVAQGDSGVAAQLNDIVGNVTDLKKQVD